MAETPSRQSPSESAADRRLVAAPLPEGRRRVVALPRPAVAPAARGARQPKRLPASATGRAAADGVRHLSQRLQSRSLVADRRRGKTFQLNQTMAALESVKHQIQVISGLDHLNADPGPRRRRRPRPRNATLLTGCPCPQDGRRRHSSRHLRRPGRGPADRPSDSFSLARAHQRPRTASQRLRQRLRVCVSVQRLLAVRTSRRCRPSRIRGCCSSGSSAKGRTASAAKTFGLASRRSDRSSTSCSTMPARSAASSATATIRSSTSISRASARSKNGSCMPRVSAAVPDPAVDTPPGVPPEVGDHMDLMYDLLLLGVPDRFDADRHDDARPRRRQSPLPAARRRRRAPQHLAPSGEARPARQDRPHRPAPRRAFRPLPREAARLPTTSTAARSSKTR